MAKEIADQLCELVQSRQVADLVGSQDPEGRTRRVEPHAVYIGSNNRGFVDFYQRSGWSASGGLPGWRRFALSDVVEVRPSRETFEPRADYRPENRGWYRAFVCTSADQASASDPMSEPPEESASHP
jgi:hypothetical protein